MKVLIISTLPNLVIEILQVNQEIELFIVDCAKDYNTIAERVNKLVIKQNPDLILTYRCPYILPYDIFMHPCLGAYNIHPSLLPKYPGLNPWTKVFANKEKIHGVTLHKISKQIDHGTILLQKEYRIELNDTIDTARQKADKIAAELATHLIDTLFFITS